MKKILLGIGILGAFTANAQLWNPKDAEMKPQMTEFWEPEVAVVTPGANPVDAPSDAIVLFDGTAESFNKNWSDDMNKDPKWKVEDNCFTVVLGTGNIKTKMAFEDFQLHIEWRTPAKVDPAMKSQNRGNSGIVMLGKYEVQVLDSYENRSYRNGQAGSLYKQYAPLVNVCKKPGEWQTYDIIFTAPRFKADSTVFTPARVTVIQNGVLIQNNVQLYGTTEYIGLPMYHFHGPDSIYLQNHGNFVSYRNIWIRKL